MVLPSSGFSSCFPSTEITPLATLTLSSSGRYWDVSKLTSNLSLSSFIRITSLSLFWNMSVCLEKSVLNRLGIIHLLGIIQPCLLSKLRMSLALFVSFIFLSVVELSITILSIIEL